MQIYLVHPCTYLLLCSLLEHRYSRFVPIRCRGLEDRAKYRYEFKKKITQQLPFIFTTNKLKLNNPYTNPNTFDIK